MDKFEYTCYVETFKEHVKSDRIRQALLRHAATGGNIFFGFDWIDVDPYDDDWESALTIDYIETCQNILYWEGTFLRVSLYGYLHLSLLNRLSYGYTDEMIHISDLESELKNLYESLRQEVLEEELQTA